MSTKKKPSPTRTPAAPPPPLSDAKTPADHAARVQTHGARRRKDGSHFAATVDEDRTAWASIKKAVTDTTADPTLAPAQTMADAYTSRFLGATWLAGVDSIDTQLAAAEKAAPSTRGSLPVLSDDEARAVDTLFNTLRSERRSLLGIWKGKSGKGVRDDFGYDLRVHRDDMPGLLVAARKFRDAAIADPASFGAALVPADLDALKAAIAAVEPLAGLPQEKRGERRVAVAARDTLHHALEHAFEEFKSASNRIFDGNDEKRVALNELVPRTRDRVVRRTSAEGTPAATPGETPAASVVAKPADAAGKPTVPAQVVAPAA